MVADICRHRGPEEITNELAAIGAGQARGGHGQRRVGESQIRSAPSILVQLAQDLLADGVPLHGWAGMVGARRHD